MTSWWLFMGRKAYITTWSSTPGLGGSIVSYITNGDPFKSLAVGIICGLFGFMIGYYTSERELQKSETGLHSRKGLDRELKKYWKK